MKTHKTQRARLPRLTPLAALLATSFAALPVYAQSSNADAAKSTAETDANLNRVVVTGTSQKKSKMRSSVSVTDIDQDQIKDFAGRTEAEVLLLIPGVRTDSNAGPAGNANITVRGLPIASGGSKYVQLQEDGLPTVQFGDMNFGNNDYWIRFDNSVDTIQALRGGSSSVFASHAPGAVINYISRTGKEAGGAVGLTRGLNYDETRFDGNYGGQLGSGLYFHVGGYYREGEGTRNYGANALQGYQLKGNITKEFNGEKGYVRVNFKVLDEHAPTTPQTFSAATRSGTSIGGFAPLAGYDGSRDSQYSIYNGSFTSINPATRQVQTTSLLEGITVKSKSVGFEFHNETRDGFTIDNRFRISSNSGAFQTQFWDVQTLANLIGTSTNEARYFNGPGAGTVVTAGNLATGLVSRGAAINTTSPDMGIMVNDLSVSKQLKFDPVTLDVRGGLFHSRQSVVQNWAISERIVEAAPNGRVIDLYNGSGATASALTTAGLTGYNNQWGGCCARDIDAKFTTTAPYAALSAGIGNLDLDAGVRRETFKANGRYAAPSRLTGGLDVNGDGVVNGAETNVYVANTASPGLVNYKINYTNYSVGANYRFTNDFSVFARHSKGYRAIADRLLYSANIDTITGQLTNRTAALAPVQQSEIGVKAKGNTGNFAYGVAATLFHSTNKEFDYDQTRPDVAPTDPLYRGPKLNIIGYKASGVELETGAAFGNFGLVLNTVYSKETITENLGQPSVIGKTSAGVPKLRYNISPRYTYGGLTVGATIRGNSKVFAGGDNVDTISGHFIVSGFANYDFGNGLIAALNVNNLLDKFHPAGGGGFVAGSTTVYGSGIQTGRTISASVRYKF